ncbi:flagellar assembly protein FlaA [Leptospira idonii]|uniref:Flagellar assembly protein FlaA n=1 Tax=Leptospira idonii TaxID=1193500 RepID=A0A4R9M947_9LEPT|nr:flagellar assembly protein FlaA [Leptospira idonii]TGN21018.1 flagellar assembly protein FlaA [Leptospira idonii]
MIALRNITFLSIFLCIAHVREADVTIWKEILLENFETQDYSQANLRTRLEKDTILPDLSLSGNFTAPIPGSRQALVLRVPKAANFPFSVYFPQPILIKDYVKEIHIPVYSSQSIGNLTLIIENQDFEIRQIAITSLNYKGWKNCVVPLTHSVDQNDRVFLQGSSLKLLGFFYLPNENNSNTQEVLLAIDDITAIVRDKYRPLRNKELLLED